MQSVVELLNFSLCQTMQGRLGASMGSEPDESHIKTMEKEGIAG